MRVSREKIKNVAMKVSELKSFADNITSHGNIDDETLKRCCREVGFNATSDRTILMLHDALCNI